LCAAEDLLADARHHNPRRPSNDLAVGVTVQRRFTYFVLGALLLGILVGCILHATLPDAATASAVAGYLSIVTDVFLRLIKMIIAPLVFATLVGGIAHMENSGAIGRIGLKTLAWFLGASIVSLGIGLVVVQILQPGAHLGLHTPQASGATVDAAALTLQDFVTHLVPTSIVDAMARNEILQIVVFSVLLGMAMVALGERAAAVLVVIEQIGTIMLKVTGYVITCAPLAVFASIAAAVTTQGVAILGAYAKFIGGFYASLAVLWLILFAAMTLQMGGRSVELMRIIKDPALLAFSTASSEAAYPLLLERLQTFGIPVRIVSFVLPLGYSFNLDGSMMYCTFAILFIAQAYGIELSLMQEMTMLLVLLVTSKGIAGVPRASLVVIAATLAYFKLPEAGLLLVLAVDHLLDMGRSATNVIGNSVAAVIVARWEGELPRRADALRPASISTEF
jgi:Na+/H+-dicarboxylate symporter